MSARERVSGWLGVGFTLLLLPARLAEELIHAAAALPFADTVFVRLDPRGDTAETVVQWRDETPSWAITAAAVAPEVLAALAGVAVLAWWVVGPGAWLPDSTTDWVLLWILGTQYLAVAMPEQRQAGGTDRGQLTSPHPALTAFAVGTMVAVLVVAEMIAQLPADPPSLLVGPTLDVSGVALAGVAAALLAIGVAWSVWEVRRHDGP